MQCRKRCLDIECAVKLLLWIFSGSNSKTSRGQLLLSIYITLLESAETLMKSGRRRTEEEHDSKCLKRCVVLADKRLCFAEKFFQESICLTGKKRFCIKERLILKRTRGD